jgi:hypothetical protein
MSRKPNAAGFIPPMLPTLVDEAPDGDEWVHEIKYDGYREFPTSPKDESGACDEQNNAEKSERVCRSLSEAQDPETIEGDR